MPFLRLFWLQEIFESGIYKIYTQPILGASSNIAALFHKIVNLQDLLVLNSLCGYNHV